MNIDAASCHLEGGWVYLYKLIIVHVLDTKLKETSTTVGHVVPL